ncbi:hypothetical protein ACFX11_025982 [Malus domestica]
MARSSKNIVSVSASHADLLLPDACGLFLFCMILMSFSVISVVIFSCGKSSSKKRKNTHHGDGGDGDGHGGHGGGHHGGGGDGHGGHGGGHHGGHGGGDHGGGGGGCGSSIYKTKFQEIQAY